MPVVPLSLETLRQRHGYKWQRYASDVLPVWVADMDFALAPPIDEFLRAAVANGDAGYPDKEAQSRVLELFVERMHNRFSWDCQHAEVRLLTDVVQGLYIAVQNYSKPGSHVLMQTPIYPPFISSVTDNKRHVLANKLRKGANRFELDLGGIDTNKLANTQLMMICNPHNPSGRVFTRVELEQLAEFALQHDLIVVADEIHSDLIFDDGQHIPFASLNDDIAARTITFNSASKAFNIAGLRVAVAVFGSVELAQRFDSIPEKTFGGLSAFAAQATAIAWSQCDGWLLSVVDYLQRNRDYLTDRLLSSGSPISLRKPEATYLAWLDFSKLDLKEEPHDYFLREAKLALSPGAAFGEEGTHCARINFATSSDILEQATERLLNAAP